MIGDRFQTPTDAPYESEYDIPSNEIQDMIERAVAPIKVITNQINLASAGTLALPSEIGYGFAMYAVSTSTGRKYIDALINVNVNQADNTQLSSIFPCKSGRGFRGAFSKLFLQWAADTSGTYTVYFIIFKSRQYPWQGGSEAS